MSFLKKVRDEVKEVLPAIVFLFVTFHLIAFTNSLLLESYRITPTRSMFATIGALVGGKAILVANRLPITHFFRTRPLVLCVLWRSIVYGTFCALFLTTEHFVSGALHGKTPAETIASQHISAAHVCANALWLAVSLVLFNSYVELDRVFGKGTLRKVFLTAPQASADSGQQLTA